MKGKIFVGLLFGILGAIYAFLVYPLLKNSEFRAQSIEPVILNEVKDLSDYQDSSPIESGQAAMPPDTLTLSRTGQNDDTKELVADSQQPAANTICSQSTCFTIEIADTPALRAQGLMNRPSLPQDAGMLFVFDTPRSYGFWMKNTLIPLDIIWLDENLIVVDTATMTPCTADPCPTYNHSGQALYVLEINAGLVTQYGIVSGQQFTRK